MVIESGHDPESQNEIRMALEIHSFGKREIGATLDYFQTVSYVIDITTP